MKPTKPLAKVPIGTAWQPRKASEITPEEEWIQDVLLTKPRQRRLRWGLIFWFVACVAWFIGMSGLMS